MRILFIVYFTLFLIPLAMAYPYQEVKAVIADKYKYKEWSENELEMLSIQLDDRAYHGQYGKTEFSERMEFRRENLPLAAKVTKEILKTEKFDTRKSSYVTTRMIYDLSYGYTKNEILQIVRDIKISTMLINLLAGFGASGAA